MSAHTVQRVGPDATAVAAPDRVRARLEAHRMVQRVQLSDTGDEVAELIAVAESNCWSEVVRVLLYADLVKAWVTDSDDREAVIQRLLDRAAADDDQVLLASGLASHAEYRYASATASVRERANRDLARAAALLEAGGGGALERGTAYIDCGLAYGQRELWELEEEMYDRASAATVACEEPLLVPALALNRAHVHVHTACSLRELGDEEGLRRLRERVAAAAADGTSTGAARAPDVFAVGTRVVRQLLSRLFDEEPAEESATLDRALTAAGTPTELADHGTLRLADALHAAALKHWDEVARQAAAALPLLADVVGPSLVALTLRIATQADCERGTGGAERAMAYCDWSVRRRWDARLQLLAAARASLEAEQLRVERDEHARQAHVDELTGLANRRGYTRHTERLRDNGGCETLSILVVDIDSFKAVNDEFGHTVGDAVLVQVAQVLARGSRPDDLVARVGGDEFLMLLDGIDAEAARRRAAELVAGLAQVDWSSLAPGLDVGISIGIAAGVGDDPQTFLLRADEALYRAKRQGGGGVSLADA